MLYLLNLNENPNKIIFNNWKFLKILDLLFVYAFVVSDVDGTFDHKIHKTFAEHIIHSGIEHSSYHTDHIYEKFVYVHLPDTKICTKQ